MVRIAKSCDAQLLIRYSYDQFRDIVNITDLDSPYQNVGVSFSETSTRSTAKRLRRTRQHLGSYRHDLLVAMRVVNNVEREMIRAEWENWLLDENTRCRQAQVMLRENRTTVSTSRKGKQQVLIAKNEKSERMDGLRKWQEEYCGSCKLEQDMLRKERNHLAFG